MALLPAIPDRLEQYGFVVLEELDGVDLALLRSEADRILGAGAAGARNVLARSEALREAGESGAVGEIVRRVVGAGARAVQLTLFDKTPEANWKVPWHQDLTIAVAARHEVEGFGPWSVKQGVVHVQPPAAVLEGLLGVRVHLDDTPEGNGALRVVPFSHCLGRIAADDVARIRRERGEVVCPVPAGGAMLLRPLLLHASSAAAVPQRRRVLHYLFAARSLPGGLAWT